MNPLSPLILQAQISPPAGGGSFGLADTTRLENPFQAPMWLDEIRFRLPLQSQGTSSSEAWSSISVQLKLGNLQLTQGFVPIGLLGKVLNDSVLVNNPGVGDTQLENSPSVFTWKLPRPLFIPARELLRPTIYFSPYSGAPNKTVTIIYCCRPLPKGTPEPKTLHLPWVTSYVPPTLTTPNAVDTINHSTPADLYNPWDQELRVQRFIGRFMAQGIPAAGAEDDGNMDMASALVDLNTGLITSGTFVTAQDSYNNILIRDVTPFTNVFCQVDRSWTVNCILPPKGFYLFTIDRQWNAVSTPAITATVGISMVGYREVRYEEALGS